MTLIDFNTFRSILQDKRDEAREHKMEYKNGDIEKAQYDGMYIGFKESLNELRNMPKIEAEPLVYGEWIYMYASDVYGWDSTIAGQDPIIGHMCSRCKNEALVNDVGDEILTNYCPNCGAKMKK